MHATKFLNENSLKMVTANKRREKDVMKLLVSEFEVEMTS
jgi:hypothetical protein